MMNLIDRKNDGKSIQKIINLWMIKNLNIKKTFGKIQCSVKELLAGY